ncbi:hypothetical protein V1264_007448 [Littorina saxatilis]|uniref:Uncharacterized protein n=1 Tax=Littorina saxatilis TaxID=31220 RepID=A0AAN9G3R9_9CAEN
MSSYAVTILAAILCVILMTSQCHSRSVLEDELEDRAKRQLRYWHVVPMAPARPCFNRGCYDDTDCCADYACTGLRVKSSGRVESYCMTSY